MRRVIDVLFGLAAGALFGALLVPAIVRVRQAAERSECVNNLRQLGLAVANYHDQLGCFPGAALPNPSLAPQDRLSWLVVMVPYIEANRIYSKMDKEKSWQAEENRFAALLDLKYLHCPAQPINVPTSTLVPSYYVGITGLGADAASLPQGDPAAGFFGYDRVLTLKQVQGRTSTLLVAGDTPSPEGAWTAAGRPTLRGLERGERPYLAKGGQFDGPHRYGTNFVFADGSTRSLGPETTPEVFEAMATVRGRESAALAGDE